jgi:hypothetical protein
MNIERIAVDKRMALKMFWNAGFNTEYKITKVDSRINHLDQVTEGYYYADDVSKLIQQMTLETLVDTL